MQLSLYNEDNFEYFGVIDLPDDIASQVIKDAENSGTTPEELVSRIIMETFYNQRPEDA